MLNAFFKNSGKRIQNLAEIIFTIEVVFAIIGGTVMAIHGISQKEFLPIVIAPFAVAASIGFAWLSTIFMFGFGELIENTRNLKSISTVSDNNVSKDRVFPEAKECDVPLEISTDFVPCPVCGADVSNDNKFCHVCKSKI